jgi:hypothetical protein
LLLGCRVVHHAVEPRPEFSQLSPGALQATKTHHFLEPGNGRGNSRLSAPGYTVGHGWGSRHRDHSRAFRLRRARLLRMPERSRSRRSGRHRVQRMRGNRSHCPRGGIGADANRDGSRDRRCGRDVPALPIGQSVPGIQHHAGFHLPALREAGQPFGQFCAHSRRLARTG